jgi:uncharacterized repeat protein (TIGR01451 family)
MKKSVITVLAALLCASCATTKTYWVPVYSLKTSEVQENSGFDPAAKAITNPEEGVAFAYYVGENKKAIVYSSPYSLSLARKIVLENSVLKASESTAEPTSNLLLSKSFFYDPKVKTPDNVEALLSAAGIDYRNAGFSKTPADVYRDNLYLKKDDNLLVFDQRLLRDGQELEYVISGMNIGTDNLTGIVVLDVLPPGFDPVETGYWFSNQADSQKTPGGAGFFEHKKVVDNGRTSLVFKGILTAPFKPGDEFRIKVKVRLDLSRLNKEFTSR